MNPARINLMLIEHAEVDYAEERLDLLALHTPAYKRSAQFVSYLTRALAYHCTKFQPTLFIEK